MSEDLMVQGQQRPSAMPYALGGAIIGGAAGAGASKIGCGMKTAAYKSWEDAVQAATDADSFVSKQIAKGGDNKAAWEAVKTQAEAVQKAEKVLKDIKLPEGFNAATELEAFADKTLAKEVAEKALEGKKKELFNSALEAIKKSDKYTIEGVGELDNKALLAHIEQLDEAGLKKLVESNTEHYGSKLTEVTKDAQSVVDNATKDAKDALEALNKKNNLSDDIRNSYVSAKRGLNEVKGKAKEALKEDIISKLKKPSMLKTAAAVAAVGLLLGLALRPKAPEV